MAIQFPTYKQIVERIRSDIATNIPGIDPTIHGSFEKGFADGLAGRSFDIIQLLKQIVNESFIQTQSTGFLDISGTDIGLPRLQATSSSGNVIFTGTLATNIPVATQIKSDSTGEIYTTDSALTISTNTINVASIARTGSTATATTASNHNFATGLSVNILGANEPEYNGSFLITVTGSTTFDYTVTGTPATPATGAITVDYTGILGSVTSSSQGEITNLNSGAVTDLITPITGVNSSQIVTFDGITGGTDTELDTDYRKRIFRRKSKPVTNFNVGAIEEKCFSVDGVTRVLVKRITPSVGDVTVLFVRDNDINILPGSSEITAVKNKIIEILPVTSSSANVFVQAPTAIITNFTFTAILPDTSTMRTAITNTLKGFFTDSVAFETTVTQDAYKCVIAGTIDTQTGDNLQSFTLSAPLTDITVIANELAIIGTITFP